MIFALRTIFYLYIASLPALALSSFIYLRLGVSFWFYSWNELLFLYLCVLLGAVGCYWAVTLELTQFPTTLVRALWSLFSIPLTLLFAVFVDGQPLPLLFILNFLVELLGVCLLLFTQVIRKMIYKERRNWLLASIIVAVVASAFILVYALFEGIFLTLSTVGLVGFFIGCFSVAIRYWYQFSIQGERNNARSVAVYIVFGLCLFSVLPGVTLAMVYTS